MILLCKNAQEFNREDSEVRFVLFERRKTKEKRFSLRFSKIRCCSKAFLTKLVKKSRREKFRSVRVPKPNPKPKVRRRTKSIGFPLRKKIVFSFFSSDLEISRKRLKKNPKTKNVKGKTVPTKRKIRLETDDEETNRVKTPRKTVPFDRERKVR